VIIGIVSDTHGHVANTQRAVRVLHEFAPAAIIHCGDIGSADVVRLFDDWPTHFVLGNVDEGVGAIERAIAEAGQTNYRDFGRLDLGSRRIAFLHGHDTVRLRAEIASGRWDLLCHGHTHKRDLRREKNGTVVLNPGALYRAQPHSLAIVDLATLDVTNVAL
jgi:putative phosphoesterase